MIGPIPRHPAGRTFPSCCDGLAEPSAVDLGPQSLLPPAEVSACGRRFRLPPSWGLSCNSPRLQWLSPGWVTCMPSTVATLPLPFILARAIVVLETTLTLLELFPGIS